MNQNHKQLVDANNPVLKAIAAEVQPGEYVGGVMKRMIDVCNHSKVKAAGLAAPQIGVSKRLIYINLEEIQFFMINPEIMFLVRPYTLDKEGCLSYPGKEKVIARCSCVRVNYQTPRREQRSDLYNGYIARVIQHEIDHLNGICRVGDDSPPDGEISAKLSLEWKP